MSKPRKKPMRWRYVHSDKHDGLGYYELRREGVLMATVRYAEGWFVWRTDNPVHGAGRETKPEKAKRAAVAWVKQQEARDE